MGGGRGSQPDQVRGTTQSLPSVLCVRCSPAAHPSGDAAPAPLRLGGAQRRGGALLAPVLSPAASATGQSAASPRTPSGDPSYSSSTAKALEVLR